MIVKTKSWVAKAKDIKTLEKEEKDEYEWNEVRHIIILTNQEMNELKRDFLKDRDYLKGLKGQIMVTNGITELLIDTSGYDYARYVARIVEKKAEI